MRIKLLFLIGGLTLCVPAWATIFTAASCNEADVQTAITNAVNAAHDGDIVSIPAGVCIWSGTTQVAGSFTSSVTIQGAGAISATNGGSSTSGSDVTVIYDNINHSSGPGVSLELDTIPGKSLRVTGIALLMNSSSTATNTGVLFFPGTSTAVRVDHCHFFTNAGSGMIGVQDSVNGVIDHNYFDAPSGALNTTLELRVGSSWNGDTVGHGDKSWADTDHWGSSLFIFVEDNRFHNGDIGDANADGSRYVLRYNTITIDALTGQQGLMFNHGTNPGRSRSMRAAEVYQNTFTQPGTTGVNTGTFALNGGTLLYWGNTVTQYRSAISVDYTRKNNGTYNYGSTPSNWGNCDDVSLFTAWDGPSPGYPCLDAPGRGAGDLLTGTSFPNVVNSTTGTISFAHQALSPIYVWDNTWTPAGGYSPVFLVGSQTVMAADNRDFYQQFGTNAEPGSNCTAVNSCNITVGINQTNRAPVNTGGTADTCTAGPGGNTPGVGWWNTSNNTLWVCNPTNHWSIYYTPFTYPHPLVAGVSFTGGIAFGNVNTGSSSTLSTTLQNTTTSSASIGPFSASPSQFTISTGSGACPSTGTLLAGATCTVYVQFSPTSAVGYSGTLTDAGSGATTTLTGTGTTGTIPPTINWSPTTITFLNTAVGSNAYSLTTVLTNTGASGSTLNVALSFGGTNPGDFTCTNGTPLCGCPSTITSGSCTVTVKFFPTATGTRTATLIETDATASNNPQSVTLIGSSTCTSTSIKYPSGTNSRHTLCGSNFTEVDPASMVTNTYNPVPGNSILVMADWCAPTGCGTTTDNTTATLSVDPEAPVLFKTVVRL